MKAMRIIGIVLLVSGFLFFIISGIAAELNYFSTWYYLVLIPIIIGYLLILFSCRDTKKTDCIKECKRKVDMEQAYVLRNKETGEYLKSIDQINNELLFASQIMVDLDEEYDGSVIEFNLRALTGNITWAKYFRNRLVERWPEYKGKLEIAKISVSVELLDENLKVEEE